MSNFATLDDNGSVTLRCNRQPARIIVGNNEHADFGGGTVSLVHTNLDGSTLTLKEYTASPAAPDIITMADGLTLELAEATAPDLYLEIG